MGRRSKVHLPNDCSIFVWAGSSRVNRFFLVPPFSIGLVQGTLNLLESHRPLLFHSYGSDLLFAFQSTHLPAFTRACSTLDLLDLLPGCSCTSSITVLSWSREQTRWKKFPFIEQNIQQTDRNKFGFVPELTPMAVALLSAFRWARVMTLFTKSGFRPIAKLSSSL